MSVTAPIQSVSVMGAASAQVLATAGVGDAQGKKAHRNSHEN